MVIDVTKLFGDDSGELDDNLQTYFVETKEYKRITEGNVFLVSGKRGTGKSSIAKITNDNMAYSVIVRPTNLEIDTIREEALRNLDETFRPKLAKVWINAIYGEIAKYIYRRKPKETYTNSRYLSRYIDFVNDISPELEPGFLDSFLRYTKLLTTSGQNSDSTNRRLFNNPQIEALDREIEHCLKPSGERFFILLDNLDDDYDINPEFTALLVDALIVACIQILRQSDFVRPVIFIRNDILSYIANTLNSAVAQMRSNKVELTWTTDKLLSVLNNRFSIYFTGSKPSTGTESHTSLYLKGAFPEYYSYFGKGGRKIEKPIGHYITERSLMRPREVIQFCRKIIEVNDYNVPLNSKKIQDSEPRFVSEFMDDLCAEYKNIYPNLGGVLELFRKGRYDRTIEGWNWTVDDLSALFDSNTYLLDHDGKPMSLSKTLNALFQIGFLRAVSKVRRPGHGVERKYVSSVEDSDFPTDNVDEFDIHRLFRSQLKYERAK